MSPDDDIEKLREVLKALGEGLPSILNSVTNLAYDPKRVAAFATSTAEFYRQLREAGVPEDKAAELTKSFMERMNPMGPLGGLLGASGMGDLDEMIGKLGKVGKMGKVPKRIVFKVGDSSEDEEKE